MQTGEVKLESLKKDISPSNVQSNRQKEGGKGLNQEQTAPDLRRERATAFRTNYLSGEGGKKIAALAFFWGN